MYLLILKLILLRVFYLTGIDASTVFVQTGGDVFLNVSEADIPQDLHFFLWKFVSNDVLVSFFSNGEPKIHEAYAGRIELLGQKHSIKLKNLQKSDTGSSKTKLIKLICLYLVELRTWWLHGF
uniref:Laminin G domain-containing protein n=1 Tax=Fundulus heteroclitus TaxID=8078 RepID=A0A3Q2R2Y7_FUNHE